VKQVYVASDVVNARIIYDMLNSAGIEACIKGESLTGGAGDLPVNLFPTIWVVDDRDEDKAISLVEDFESSRPADQMFDNVWVCPGCTEIIEAQFTQCWSCGYHRSRR